MRLVFLRIPVAEKRFRWIESIGGATCIVVVFFARDLVLHLTPLTHADGVGGKILLTFILIIMGESFLTSEIMERTHYIALPGE
jgi:hypothetical protein